MGRLPLPEPYDFEATLRRPGERLGDRTQRLTGRTWEKALRRPYPHVLRVRFVGAEAEVEALGAPAPPTALVRHLIGAEGETADLLAAARRDPVLADLIAWRPGLRPFGYEDVYEALVATILGQQVGLGVAARQRGALVERLGRPAGLGLRAFPEPEALLGGQEVLGALGLTAQKRAALVAVAEEAAAGRLVARFTAGERIRGVGAWTRAWVALHGLGHRDADLSADLGVRRAIAAAHGLAPDDRAGVAAVVRRHGKAAGWAALYYLEGWAHGRIRPGSAAGGAGVPLTGRPGGGPDGAGSRRHGAAPHQGRGG